jgi:hypothetical protein
MEDKQLNEEDLPGYLFLFLGSLNDISNAWVKKQLNKIYRSIHTH